MASLRPGVLLKLLQCTEASSSASDDDSSDSPCQSRGPALLQVTGITPALEGPDLFPGRGFYLRVSDASHSSYVSLLPDHDDLILADRLQTGQLIHVRRLEPAVPVPILREFQLLPGRHPCIGDSTDLIAPAPHVSPCSGSDIKEIISSSALYRRPPPLPGRKANKPKTPRSRSIPTSPVNGSMKKRELERRNSEVLTELRKISITCGDEDSGDDSDESRFSWASSSSSSSRIMRATTVRKYWDPSERIKEGKTLSRSRNASVSPNRVAKCHTSVRKTDAANDLLASKRETERAFKVLGSYSKQKLFASDTMTNESSCTEIPFSSSSNIKWPENSIVWASLPSRLAKHGKEAMKHRDAALQATLDALLEASASEKLIQCLSVYSELQSEKDDEPKDFIERFLKFQHDLDEAISIAQSLIKLRQSRTCGCNVATSASAKAAAKVTLERTECAFSWIKAALESELSRFPNEIKTTIPTDVSVTDVKLLVPMSLCHKPNCACIDKRRNNSDIFTKRSSLIVVSNMANVLQMECTKWFLRYIEKFLDAVEKETDYASYESQVASLLHQLKRVDDWLNDIAKKDRLCPIDRSKDSMLSEDEENEACERVRRKIYSILLKHVESAANALESLSATDEEKE
ncbi:uncharacterized protein [Typha angustifolia]|uniref:uncharacterized protein n=1 Tax=Typha angustifolia TaxID=59011 RepID=UPI003C2F9DBF